MANNGGLIPTIRGKNSGSELLGAARFLHTNVIGKQSISQFIYRIIFIMALSGFVAWVVLGSITAAIVGGAISLFSYYLSVVIENNVRNPATTSVLSEPQFEISVDEGGLTQIMATRISRYPWTSIE